MCEFDKKSRECINCGIEIDKVLFIHYFSYYREYAAVDDNVLVPPSIAVVYQGDRGIIKPKL